MSGFQKIGIHPFNPEIFNDDDFMCPPFKNRDFPQHQALTKRVWKTRIEFATELEGSSQLEENATIPIDFPQEPENSLSNIDHRSVNELLTSIPVSPYILGIENISVQNVPHNAYESLNGSK